jgi:hypothetical protein
VHVGVSDRCWERQQERALRILRTPPKLAATMVVAAVAAPLSTDVVWPSILLEDGLLTW